MSLAVWKDSQKAEYNADYAAASVAGTRATASALKKLCYAPTYYKTLEAVVQYQYTQNLFDEFRGRFHSMPAREVERIRILTEIMESYIEATHPPTRYRLSYIVEKLTVTLPVLPNDPLVLMEKEFHALESVWEKKDVSGLSILYVRHLLNRVKGCNND